MKKYLAIILICLFIPVSLGSQDTVTIQEYNKVKNALVDYTLLFNNSLKQNNKLIEDNKYLSKVIDSLAKDLLEIKEPSDELKKILEKYKIESK